MTKEKNSQYSENNLRLSVQVSLAGLSFLVVNPEAGSIVFFKEIPFENMHTPEEVLEKVKYAYQTTPQLNTSFETIEVIHHNTLFTLVPNALFDEGKLSDYVKFSSKLFPTDYLDVDGIDTLEMKNVYVPLTNVNNYFFDKYGAFTFQHSNTIFINAIITAATHNNQPAVYAHFSENCLDVLVTKGKNVLLCNSFSIKTPEDFIYYLLFVAEQLQLNPEEFPLYLTGSISEESPYYEMAFTYVRNVKLLPKKSRLKLDGAIADETLFQTHFLLTYH